MEVTGELHDPATLQSGKEGPVPTGKNEWKVSEQMT